MLLSQIYDNTFTSFRKEILKTTLNRALFLPLCSLGFYPSLCCTLGKIKQLNSYYTIYLHNRSWFHRYYVFGRGPAIHCESNKADIRRHKQEEALTWGVMPWQRYMIGILSVSGPWSKHKSSLRLFFSCKTEKKNRVSTNVRAYKLTIINSASLQLYLLESDLDLNTYILNVCD